MKANFLIATLQEMDFAFRSMDNPPQTLYHYTSLAALVSIVQSRRIWASNIRFLNDHSESLWLRDHVLSILDTKSAVEDDRDRIKQIVAEIENSPPLSCFVASFTERADDLSQWRAYCPPRRGVCIGFDTKCLAEQTASIANIARKMAGLVVYVRAGRCLQK